MYWSALLQWGRKVNIDTNQNNRYIDISSKKDVINKEGQSYAKFMTLEMAKLTFLYKFISIQTGVAKIYFTTSNCSQEFTL